MLTRRSCLAAALVVSALAVTNAPASAQPTKSPFTAEDLLKVTTFTVLDLAGDGSRVAVSARTAWDNPETDHRRYGDPTYLPPSHVTLLVIDTRDGTTQRPFADVASVRRAAWSHDGVRLAILAADESGGVPVARLFVWDAVRATLTEIPRQPGHAIAVNTGLEWTPDGTKLVVTLRDPAQDREAQSRFKALTEGPVIEHTSAEPFLEWDALTRTARERELVDLEVRSGRASPLLPRTRITSYDLARDGTFLAYQQDVTPKTDYDVIGGSEHDVMLLERGATPRRLARGADLKDARLQWSDDGRWFAYAKKGEVFVQRVSDEKPRSVTPRPSAKEEDRPPTESAAGTKKEEPESFTVGPFSPDASTLLVTSKKGWYAVSVADAVRTRFLPLDEDEEKNPRLSALQWSPDGKGVYATFGERSRWERGLVRIDVATKEIETIVKDTSLYSNVQLSRDGSTAVFTRSDGNAPAEVFALRLADAGRAAPRQLTSLNDWVSARALPTSELVPYRDADGKQLYGVLRYPVSYVRGQRYPTVFEIYETFFDNGFNGRAAFLANHGYAVFHPSVNLVVGRPGESWLKGVTAAANELIARGVADPARLGVHGTSYGGYATVLLITQTDRFKAAINISGKVNLVSFYTDSPRLGVRNTHAPEKSQDRIGGTLWEYPERYLEHSAILQADRIKTPLLCITGDQDPNVPASQSREIYYALRRLGKDVSWVRYVNGGHRPPNSNAESIDFEQRILAWYDKYLKKTDAEKKTEEVLWWARKSRAGACCSWHAQSW